MANCDFDKLTGGFSQNCDRPIKSGLKSKGIIINVDDIDSWVNSGSANQFLPVMKAGKIAFPIEVIGATPFNGTNVASLVDEYQRSFTKTVVFNIPESGSAAALRVEQLTKSLAGYVIVVEGKDAGGDLNGTFVIFGKNEPLLCTVAKDYVAGVSAPIITATSIESGYENFLFQTDLAITKTDFDVFYAGDLTKRIYFLELAEGTGDIELKITLLTGTAPITEGLYSLVVSSVNAIESATATASEPTILELAGVGIDTGIANEELAFTIHAVMVEKAAETAGVPVYFKADLNFNIQDITAGI